MVYRENARKDKKKKTRTYDELVEELILREDSWKLFTSGNYFFLYPHDKNKMAGFVIDNRKLFFCNYRYKDENDKDGPTIWETPTMIRINIGFSNGRKIKKLYKRLIERHRNKKIESYFDFIVKDESE